jgi:hypothetical protein
VFTNFYSTHHGIKGYLFAGNIFTAQKVETYKYTYLKDVCVYLDLQSN